MKKRILALLLSLSLMVSVVVPGTVAMDGGDTVDDTYTELAVNDRKTLHASHFGISAEPYQWQISIGGAWINISGETSDSITVSYAMLCNALSGDTAQVRCVGYDSEGMLIEPDAMTIRITEEVAPTPVEQDGTHPAGTVLEQAKPLGDPIIEKIEGESEDIKDQIKEKFDEFKDNAKDALDQIKDSAKEKLEELKNKIDEKNDPEPIDQTEETSAETTTPAETTAEPASTDDSAATDDSVGTVGSESTNVETDTAPTTDEDAGDDDVSDQPEMTETTGEAEPVNPADSEGKTPAAEEPADTTTEQEVTTSAPETEAPETDAPVATEPSEGSDEDQTEDIVISAPAFASPLTDEESSAEQGPTITEEKDEPEPPTENKGNDTQTPPSAPAEQTPPTAPSDPVTPAAPEKQEEPTGNTENTDEDQKASENTERKDVPSDEQNNVPTVTDSANAVPASDPAPADNEEQNRNAENGQENDTPAGETNSTYSIIINYVFAGGKQAAPSWSATVATGSNYTQDIQSPVVVGYAPSEAIVHVNTSEAKTYTVTYQPAEVEFTVKHYQQNVSNDQYTLVETESKKGFTESQVGENLAKTDYTGFYSLLYDTTTKIAADESTVVEIYYDRYYYLMNFDLDGGHGVEPIYARYGTKIDVDETALKKPGYTFDKWEGENQIPETMPAVNVSFKAIWKVAEKAKVTVVVWGENPDDEDYSYIKSSEIQVKPGTTLTKDDLTHVLTCSEEEHQHTNSCMNCAHTHTSACYGAIKQEQPVDGRTDSATENINQFKALTGGTLKNGMVYRVKCDGAMLTTGYDKYYLYNDNTWYLVTSNDVSGSAIASSEKMNAHGHRRNSDNNKDQFWVYSSRLSCTHKHTDSCYICGKAAHKHNANCYTSPLDMDGTLWRLVKCEEVTVAADGTSKLNVYYDRMKFTLHFRKAYSNNDDYDTIQKKWGPNIREEFNKKCSDAGTSNWSENTNASHPWTSYLDIMPKENRTYYANTDGYGTSTAYYYVEGLDGKDELFYENKSTGTGYTVTVEEFIEINGFTFDAKRSSKVGDSFNNAKFYYTRNSYDLNFHNHNTELTDKATTVKFEAPLKGYYFEPEYPSDLKPNAYDFAGWYTTSGCFDGSEANLNTMTMPASNVILYAKWTPKTHTVKTYLTKEKMESGKDELDTYDDVPNGTTVPSTPADPTHDPYKFVGWFYISDTGEEIAFDFSMPVNRDLNLYAKWSSNTLMEYTIKYELEDGTKIAPPTTGSDLAGTTKTFNAKTGTELNEGYQSGYFPEVGSHSITIDIDNPANNTYTFVYVAKAEVEYTVKYLEKGTGNQLADPKTVTTRDAVVTETFKQIAGYAPDAYQKQLVLAAEGNEIIFWYTKDDVHAPVQIIHWTQNIAGEEYTEYQNSTNLNAVIGAEYSETPLTIAGFTYNVTKSTASGTLAEAGLVLNLYYDRIEYPYEFRFVEKDSNTEKQLENSVAGTARYQAQVTQTAKTIPGYTLVSAENQSINIAIEDGTTAVKNVKTFYYTEQMVEIRYQVVGPDGCGKVDIYQEAQLKVFTGEPKGSTPTANEGFKFVGWFKDEACTQAVDETWIAAENKLTPQKTKDLGNNVMGYEAATYYAKFEYNLTSLTITKNGWKSIDEHQSFIFKVTGEGLPNDGLKVTITPSVNDSVTITGLTVGKEYTVTEESGWSWRYSAGTGSKILEADATQNVITINNDRNKNQWLNGCAYAPNKFGSPITNN